MIKVPTIFSLNMVLLVAQDSDRRAPQFKAEVRLAFVDVAVRSSSGSSIADLNKRDFEIVCGGVRQTIDAVDSIGLPADVAVVADVGWPNGFIPDDRFERSLDIAVGSLGDSVARIALSTIGETPRVLTEFTESRRQLSEAVAVLGELRSKARRGPGSLEKAMSAASALFSIEDDSRYRRRVIILIGYDQDLASTSDFSGLRKSLGRRNVEIIAIRLPLQRFKGKANIGAVIGDVIRQRPGGLTGIQVPPKHGYETLLAEVGGRVIDVDSQDGPAAFREQLDDLKTLYRLWFVPQDVSPEGDLALQVKLAPVAAPGRVARVQSRMQQCHF
jgi:hypothetical protein